MTTSEPDPDETRPYSSREPGSGEPLWAPYDPPATPRDESDPEPAPWSSPHPAPPATPQGPPSYGYPGPTYPAAPVPYGGMPYAYPQSHSGATTAMALGITGLVSVAVSPFFCCFTLPLGVLSPIAIGLGVKAQREIDRQPQAFGNRGHAVTGLVTGIVGTVLGVLLLVAFMTFLNSVFTYDG